MSKNTTDLRNELIGLMSEFNIWCLCDNDECAKSQNFDIAVDDLLALISNREKLARIEELESFTGHSNEIPDSEVRARIDTLRKELDGGVRLPQEDSGGVG